MTNQIPIFTPATADDIKDFSSKTIIDVVPGLKQEITVVPENQEVIVSGQNNAESLEDMEEDFKHVRKNLNDIIKKGNSVLDDMISLARASDHPRAFEVAGTLINTLVDANKDLLDIHEKKNKIKGVKPVDQQPTHSVQNNTIFVGSSTDILDIINKNKGNGR